MSGSLQRDDQFSWGSLAGLSEHITLENNMDYSVLQCSVDAFISQWAFILWCICSAGHLGTQGRICLEGGRYRNRYDVMESGAVVKVCMEHCAHAQEGP